MRVTIDLPDDLVHQAREFAARENLNLKTAISQLLRRGLAADDTPEMRHRVKLPLIEGRPALPGQELTPDRIKDILLEQDVEHYFQAIAQSPPAAEENHK